MFVAEQFTGTPGVFVPRAETVRGFKEIIEGKHDDLPEGAFMYVGSIDQAIEKAAKMQGGDAAPAKAAAKTPTPAAEKKH